MTATEYGTITETDLTIANFGVTLACAFGYASGGTPTAACTWAGDYTVADPCTCAISGDVDDNGRVDVTDVLIGLQAFGLTGAAAAASACGRGAPPRGIANAGALFAFRGTNLGSLS